MKTIKVSVDEETYRLSRAIATKAGTSVSALVRAYLVELVKSGSSEAFDRLREMQDETLEAIHARGGGLRPSENLPREALHERDPLR